MSFSNHFTFKKNNYNKKNWSHCYKVLMGTAYSLYQNFPSVPIIHQKYCHISSSKNFNITLSNHLP